MFTGEGCTLHSHRSRRRHRSRSTRRHLVRSSSHDGRCRVPDIFHKPHNDPLSCNTYSRKEVAERGVVVMVVVLVVFFGDCGGSDEGPSTLRLEKVRASILATAVIWRLPDSVGGEG